MDTVLTWIGQLLGCIQPLKHANRTVYVGNKQPEEFDAYVPEKFQDNRVISSKYTVWNFLPKNLFEQFRRIANFYFLCIGIIQLAIDSPVSPVTSILPLAFVVTVTAVKQGYEDWLRHKNDNEVNNRPSHVIRDGQLVKIKSMHIQVGDIVRVQQNQGFPCDLVMLSSQNKDGYCYITTANLDGETNLKTCKCVSEFKTFQDVEQLTQLNAHIECEQSQADLYKFVGRINIIKDIEDEEDIVCPLGPENLLLRGARLKNTPFVFGCAIYTGQETKMALNSKFKQTKFSRVERTMNIFLIVFLVILLLEASICTGLKYWYSAQPKIGQPWYVPLDKKITARTVLEDFIAFVVIFNYIIPISLYVTIEVQKFMGSMFFDWDKEMYDEESNQHARANTSDLNEELGQVQYLFTDKTGTLTENDMQFRQCSISGKRYTEVGGMLCEKADILDGQAKPVTEFTKEIENFMLVLVLCHTVTVDCASDVNIGASRVYSHSGFDYEYQASSPDEKAFVEACRRYGIVFHGIHDNHLEVTFKGEMQRYKLLHILDFDPVRKRMSVIIQNEAGALCVKPAVYLVNAIIRQKIWDWSNIQICHPEDFIKEKDEIYLLCKGAESSMIDRAVVGQIKLSAMQHVNEYSMLGLRTLVISHKRITADEFVLLDADLNRAQTSLHNREEKLAEAFDRAETNLELLGATAVEDRLQDGVPQTIDALRTAGIKIWVLTGDKEETAVNISYSAGHFKQGMMELRITKIQNDTECGILIKRHIRLITRRSTRSLELQKYALIVDGMSLALALNDYTELLQSLCKMCVAVLCCRMSPIQKAKMVKMIKSSKEKPVTAAIGDGANDVSMIQEADVGLGIMGKEGRQAVRNSDYAIARFSFLMHALLVHGHYYYIRVSTLVQYFFYKNVAFITSQVYFSFFSSFSQQSVFDSYLLMFYNIAFSSLPILMYGIFEKDIRRSLLLMKPQMYKSITKNERLSAFHFIKWNILGLWHSAVFFFGTYILMKDQLSLCYNGRIFGIWTFGAIIYTICIITVNIKLALEIYYWSLPIFAAFVFTFVVYFGLTLFYNSFLWESLIDSASLYMVALNMMSSGSVWLTFVVLTIIALLPDIIIKLRDDIYQYISYGFQRVSPELLIPLEQFAS